MLKQHLVSPALSSPLTYKVKLEYCVVYRIYYAPAQQKHPIFYIIKDALNPWEPLFSNPPPMGTMTQMNNKPIKHSPHNPSQVGFKSINETHFTQLDTQSHSINQCTAN
jgi:hypothetical protein